MMESEPLKTGDPAEEKAKVLSAVTELRSNCRFLRNVPIVYMPEVDPGRNTSFAAYYLAAFADQNVITMSEAKAGNYGIQKTDLSTFDMTYLFKELLAEKKIYFSDHLFSLNGKEPDELVKMLADQTRRYVWDYDEIKDKFKLTGKKGGKQDDLLIAAMMVPRYRQMFIEKARSYEPYKHFLEKAGKIHRDNQYKFEN